MQQVTHPVLDLVLIGGGHSHAILLRMFGMRLRCPEYDTVTEASDAPDILGCYPVISIDYSYDECHIDLVRWPNLPLSPIIY